MSIIRQESLFTLEELFDLEPTHRFNEVFSTIDIFSILAVDSSSSWLTNMEHNLQRTDCC